jgi:F0F1-type ATP synthase membrane subunit b/b'
MLFLSLVLIQLAIFGFLVVFLRYLLTRNITHATTHLHELNQDYSQKLDEAKKRQQEADKYYDETILKAKIDAEKTRVQILKEAHDTQEVIIKEARTQSQEIVAQANKAREAMLADLERLVDERGVEKAAALTLQVLSAEIQKALHDRWVEQLLQSGFDQLRRLNLPDGGVEAEVATAFALAGDQRAALQKKLREGSGREVKLKESADPRLIAGLKIRLASTVIDGSLAFKIREAARADAHNGS